MSSLFSGSNRRHPEEAAERLPEDHFFQWRRPHEYSALVAKRPAGLAGKTEREGRLEMGAVRLS